MVYLALLLAQACVGEIDLQGNPEECAAMWHILLNKPTPIEYVIPRYISIFKVDTSRAKWVRGLNREGTVPEGFPETVSWEGQNRDGWRAILDKADAFVRNPGEHPCPRANQFGGPVDGRHADDFVPKCWKRIRCGEGFVQAYYFRPPGGCKVRASDVREAFNSKGDGM